MQKVNVQFPKGKDRYLYMEFLFYFEAIFTSHFSAFIIITNFIGSLSLLSFFGLYIDVVLHLMI